MEELYRLTICPNVSVQNGQAFDSMRFISDVSEVVDQGARVL
jgi:hypothetical protein